MSPFYKNKLQIYLLCIEKSDDVRQANNQVISPSYGNQIWKEVMKIYSMQVHVLIIL